MFTWAWELRSVISGLRRQREGDASRSEANMGYTMRSRPARVTEQDAAMLTTTTTTNLYGKTSGNTPQANGYFPTSPRGK